MTHSYDNTLLQRMGFSDPDRKLPAHDDACIQIATEPERFVRAVFKVIAVKDARGELEVPIQKGEGKYATTVGFVDAIVTWNELVDVSRLTDEDSGWCVAEFRNLAGNLSYGGHFDHCKNKYDEVEMKWVHPDCACRIPVEGPIPLKWKQYKALVEVKTKVDGFGSLLRQMNFYREYMKSSCYVIWSLDPSDSKYTQLLSQQGYTLIVGPLLP